MLKYEAVFDFISEEPYVINVKKSEKDEEQSLERILRIRRWTYNGVFISRTIFSLRREFDEADIDILHNPDCFVIRKVVWDREKDLMRIGKIQNKNFYPFPSIDAFNFFINSDKVDVIKKQISSLDRVLEKATLKNCNYTNTDFRDFEIMRLFDWGKINFVWSPYKENNDIIDISNRISKDLENIVKSAKSQYIHSLELIYSVNPEMYINSILKKEF